MYLSDLSIKRPVLAIVISLLILLAGITAYKELPVREYPDVENPVISITTTYIGASPQTIESTVTQPLEEALNGLTDVRTITSKSAFGQSSIEVEFKESRDIDLAATDVNNAIQRATNNLPEEAERPVVAKSNANSDAIMWISLQGKNYSAEELSDIADRQIKPQLQVIPGVANVIIGGQRKYAIRIWLDPKKMTARKITSEDVRSVLNANNLQLPGGQVKGFSKQFDVLVDGQIANPKIYERLVIKNENGRPVYLSDIGFVRLGSENYDSLARYEGETIVGVGIVRQSKANELSVSGSVKKELPNIIQALPKDLKVKVVVDRSLFIQAALNEVYNSFYIAFILVILVCLVFLRSASSTTIISFTIPVSIIGALAGMHLLGFSINVLTMLGMILAIGLVVDDAIVVLENIYRHQEKLNEDPLDAAIIGSREVNFPVIATTLCLVAVFIPLSLLTGTTGRLFREFSLAVAFAVIISTIVALTLTPALSSRFLKYKNQGNNIFMIFEKILSPLQSTYINTAKFAVNNSWIIFLFLIANTIASVLVFMFIPKDFVPTEDRGYFITVIKAPQGSSLAYTSEIQRKLEAEVEKIPEVVRYFSAIGLGIGGPPNPSTGIIFVGLKHWKDRHIKQQDIVAQLFGKFMQIPGAFAFPINPASLGQSTLKKDVEFVIKGSSDLKELSEISNNFLNRVRSIPGLINVDSDLLLNNPQIEINFKRKAIADAGLSISDISRTFQSLFSDSKVNTFILRSKQYDVITSLSPEYKRNPQRIKEINLKDKYGNMVPLDKFIEVIPSVAPTEVNHYNLQRSVTISGSLLPFLPLGKAIDEFNMIAKETIGPGYSTTLSGISREYIESSNSLYITFIIAVLFIYLILAATFESFITPITIILTIPLALLGALFSLKISGQSLNIYTQIGIILLIGLVTKNSILIVDFANSQLKEGKNFKDAVLEACEIRFRPILMTAATMIFGTIPLVFGHGAGAESRQSLGIVIVGGLTFATIFTLYVVPVFYIYINKLSNLFKKN